ncbi:MAG: hypothetical protein IKO89_01075 [Bacteroidales bacterium]|nr:hypothetical protein [Bacteroidales bacterium]
MRNGCGGGVAALPPLPLHLVCQLVVTTIPLRAQRVAESPAACDGRSPRRGDIWIYKAARDAGLSRSVETVTNIRTPLGVQGW